MDRPVPVTGTMDIGTAFHHAGRHAMDINDVE